VTAPLAFTWRSIDLVYDAAANRLFLSIGSGNGGLTNGVSVLNPVNGVIESFAPPARPSKLARSGDGQFLYISLPDLAVVRRLTLPTLTSNLQFTVGSEKIGSFWGALSLVCGNLAAVPGQPNAIAVSRVRQA
jgi:hypothetical protein